MKPVLPSQQSALTVADAAVPFTGSSNPWRDQHDHPARRLGFPCVFRIPVHSSGNVGDRSFGAGGADSRYRTRGEIMMRRLSTSLLTIVALVSVANIVCRAQSLPLLTRHVREVTTNGQARSVGRLPATQSMRFVLVLPLRNQAALNNFLKELYDPSNPSYRQFLTVKDFTTMFGPGQEQYSAVVSWAEKNGFTVVGTSRNRLNLDVTGSVASIEEALHVTMGVYQHPTENRTFYAPDREPSNSFNSSAENLKKHVSRSLYFPIVFTWSKDSPLTRTSCMQCWIPRIPGPTFREFSLTTVRTVHLQPRCLPSPAKEHKEGRAPEYWAH